LLPTTGLPMVELETSWLRLGAYACKRRLGQPFAAIRIGT